MQNRPRPLNILIYGSSTSLGLYCAQLVKHAFKSGSQEIYLIGVASTANHTLLRKAPYCYDFLVDYQDLQWTKRVQQALGYHGVDYALDCISVGSSVSDTESTLHAEGKLAVFRGPKGGQYDTSKLRIKPIYGAVWEGLGVEIGYNGLLPCATTVLEVQKLTYTTR